LPLIGEAAAKKEVVPRVLAPAHAWLKHLKPEVTREWLGKTANPAEFALRTSKGERLLGTPEGHAILYRTQVGKGQIIYVGWEIANSLPATRDQRPTLRGEEVFDEQMRILMSAAENAVQR
jgi:hypothetical protein